MESFSDTTFASRICTDTDHRQLLKNVIQKGARKLQMAANQLTHYQIGSDPPQDINEFNLPKFNSDIAQGKLVQITL